LPIVPELKLPNGTALPLTWLTSNVVLEGRVDDELARRHGL
jgi:hypothetical protein